MLKLIYQWLMTIPAYWLFIVGGLDLAFILVSMIKEIWDEKRKLH